MDEPTRAEILEALTRAATAETRSWPCIDRFLDELNACREAVPA